MRARGQLGRRFFLKHYVMLRAAMILSTDGLKSVNGKAENSSLHWYESWETMGYVWSQ